MVSVKGKGILRYLVLKSTPQVNLGSGIFPQFFFFTRYPLGFNPVTYIWTKHS